ncbi:VOC family protein [Sphingomonas sp. PB1R3]|uniref:VOC family protein n=1 Tax=Sphingomonas flavida TaxID=3096154 RepID=UPI002FC5DC39
MTRVTGLNHITLAVGDLDRSLAFYRDVLGFSVRAVWTGGAYLEAGSLWLCLSVDREVRLSPHPDYTHIALSVAEKDYAPLRARLIALCPIWKQDRSEGASTYFLDPDGHRMEIHLGSLESRLRHYRSDPTSGVHILDG